MVAVHHLLDLPRPMNERTLKPLHEVLLLRGLHTRFPMPQACGSWGESKRVYLFGPSGGLCEPTLDGFETLYLGKSNNYKIGY